MGNSALRKYLKMNILSSFSGTISFGYGDIFFFPYMRNIIESICNVWQKIIQIIDLWSDFFNTVFLVIFTYFNLSSLSPFPPNCLKLVAWESKFSSDLKACIVNDFLSQLAFYGKRFYVLIVKFHVHLYTIPALDNALLHEFLPLTISLEFWIPVFSPLLFFHIDGSKAYIFHTKIPMSFPNFIILVIYCAWCMKMHFVTLYVSETNTYTPTYVFPESDKEDDRDKGT